MRSFSLSDNSIYSIYKDYEGLEADSVIDVQIIILFLVFWIPIHMGRWDMILISIHQSRS